MQQAEIARSLTCPFLRLVTLDYLWMYPTGVYCRLPSGQVRVPCPDTVARTCTNASFRDCPNYRRWGEVETTPDAS